MLQLFIYDGLELVRHSPTLKTRRSRQPKKSWQNFSPGTIFLIVPFAPGTTCICQRLTDLAPAMTSLMSKATWASMLGTTGPACEGLISGGLKEATNRDKVLLCG